METKTNGTEGGQATVLVIEDDALICKLLQVVLEHHGHSVQVAETYAPGKVVNLPRDRSRVCSQVAARNARS